VAIFAIAPSSKAAPTAFTPNRSTYDAGGSEYPKGGLGTLARGEGSGPSGDAAIDAAHDNAGLVHEFYSTVLGRNSIDDRGMAIKSVVHFGKAYNNAYWDGSKMTYGDGDGKFFSPLSGALDVVGHEMTHGVVEHTAGLVYRNQSGALNESWGDVFGEVIEQWAENRSGFGTVDAALGADWLIGEDVFTPGRAGDALRSMKAPGTAYKGIPGVQDDMQPAHMKNYNKMTGDNGGVHVNSGIPNKAAYEAGVRIGSEKLAKIWYKALTSYLKSNSTFDDAAAATLAAAKQLYGTGAEAQAVADAWNAVGIVAKNTARFVTHRAGEVGTGFTPSAAGDGHDGFVPSWFR
jgi:Zn-dependent metalloprotease